MHESIYVLVDAIVCSMRVLKLQFQYVKKAVNQNEMWRAERGRHNERVILSVYFRIQAAAGGHEGLITKHHMQREYQSFFHIYCCFFF